MSPGMSRYWRAWSLTLAAAVALALGAGAFARWYVEQRPLPMTSDKVEFRVKSGTSARGAARAARDAGIDVNELAFAALARVTGVSQTLRAGRYAVDRGATLAQLVAKLRNGEVVLERLTVVEGLTFREMRALLAATPELRQDSATMTDAQLMQAIGAVEAHPEGLFAPDTYLYDPGSSDLEAPAPGVSLANERAPGRVDCAGRRLALQDALRGVDHGVDHREGNRQSAERAMIGGVFINRLRRACCCRRTRQ